MKTPPMRDGVLSVNLLLFFCSNKGGSTMTDDVIKEDQVLDCSGMLCPLPVVKTSKAMKELQSGQVLKLIATDPGAPPDMEAWSRQTGNELLRSMQEENKFIFFFRKK
jgi:tRNA 2-thiouridine synthesizing protein A